MNNNNITHRSIIFEIYDNNNKNRYIGFRKKYKDEGERNLTCDYFAGSKIKYHQNTEVAILMSFPTDLVLQKDYLRNIKNYIVYKRKEYFKNLGSENPYVMYNCTNIIEADTLIIPTAYVPLYNFCANNIDKAIKYIHRQNEIPSRKGVKVENGKAVEKKEMMHKLKPCEPILNNSFGIENKPNIELLKNITEADKKGSRECFVIWEVPEKDKMLLQKRGFSMVTDAEHYPYTKISW